MTGRWSPGSWSARPPARRRGRGPAAAAATAAPWPGRRGRPGRPGASAHCRLHGRGAGGRRKGCRRSLSRPWTPEGCPRGAGRRHRPPGRGHGGRRHRPGRPARGGRRPPCWRRRRPSSGRPAAMAPIWHLALAARDPDPPPPWPACAAASAPTPTPPWPPPPPGCANAPAPRAARHRLPQLPGRPGPRRRDPPCRRVTQSPGWWGRTRSGPSALLNADGTLGTGDPAADLGGGDGGSSWSRGRCSSAWAGPGSRSCPGLGGRGGRRPRGPLPRRGRPPAGPAAG